MKQSRTSGLLLLVLGALTFLGTTNQLLPAITFFPGVLVCALGFIVFMKANSTAMEESEAKTLKRLHPDIKNTTIEGAAKRHADAGGTTIDALEDRVAAQSASVEQVQDDELVLYEVDQAAQSAGASADPKAREDESEEDEGFVVTTDVSFPLEVQQQTSLADQLSKLRRLADDGILSEEEFAVAKAKLLD